MPTFGNLERLPSGSLETTNTFLKHWIARFRVLDGALIMECLCGCGEVVSAASFKPGHDQKLRISLERRAGGLEALRALVEEAESKTNEPTKEQCRKEVDDVFKTIQDDQSEYDKQLLTLSSAFLAASIAFIKDVEPLKQATMPTLLYLSFGLFGLCILLVLFSFQFSIAGNLKAKEYWDEKSLGNKEAVFPFRHASFAQKLNWLSGGLFGSGVVLLVIFVISNLIFEANMPTNRTITHDGALIKAPSSSGSEERGGLVKAPATPKTTNPSSTSNSGSSSSNNQGKK